MNFSFLFCIFLTAFVKVIDIGNFVAVIVAVFDENSLIIKHFHRLDMIDNLEGINTSVGFNIPEPDFMLFASADKPCYLRDSVVFLKTAEKQLLLRGFHVIELSDYELFIAVLVEECYVFRKTADGE